MADIKLKNYSGQETAYKNVPKIWLESEDSTEENPILLPFAYGEPASKTLEPDFSAGDMAVQIPEGELISELTLKKPPGLIPNNIAEGVEIAGVIGSLFAGGGGTSESVYMKTGTFKPKAATRVFNTTINTFVGFKINGNGHWEKSIASSEFVPVSGRHYYIDYISEVYATAQYNASFSNYGACITIGNKAIATGKQDDIGNGNALLIYQVNLKKLTILAIRGGSEYTSDGETWNSYSLNIWDVEECRGGVTIQHGGTTKPDAVFIIQTAALGLNDPNGLYYGVWGVKSSLAHLMKNNAVAGSLGVLGYSSPDYPLENSYNSGFLYCSDDSSFSFQDTSSTDIVVFSPGYDCWWFAIWGLTNQS